MIKIGDQKLGRLFRARDLDSCQKHGSVRSQQCPLLCPEMPEVTEALVLGLVSCHLSSA